MSYTGHFLVPCFFPWSLAGVEQPKPVAVSQIAKDQNPSMGLWDLTC